MRIAFVSPPYDDLSPTRWNDSATAIVTRELARRLARRASVAIYSGRRRPEGTATDIDGAGIEYRRIRITPENYLHRVVMDLEPNLDAGWFSLPYFASSHFYRNYAEMIARDIARRSFDIVHVHTFSQFVPKIRARNPHIKIVLHVHEDWLALLDRTSVEERLRATDLVLAPSEHTASRIRARFPAYADRCRVLHNGVDVEHFKPRRCAPERRGTDELRCLAIGRISPEKGLYVLLEAFARVREELPRARLDVYGADRAVPYNFFAGVSRDPAVRSFPEFYGSSWLDRLRSSVSGRRFQYFAALERRYGDLFDRSVFFHGGVPQTELGPIYGSADVFVYPSVCDEAFGIALLEAMASGVPALATRAGGIVDAAAEAGAVLTVGRHSAAALAEALLQLAADPKRRAEMGRKGRKFACSDMFSWDRLADRLWVHYEGMMNGRPTTAGTGRRTVPAAADAARAAPAVFRV